MKKAQVGEKKKLGLLVQQRMCATCIYRSGSPLDLKQLEAAVADRFGGFKRFRACHHATRRVVCRGFWDKYKNEFQMGQIAQRLNIVQFVNVDRLKRR